MRSCKPGGLHSLFSFKSWDILLYFSPYHLSFPCTYFAVLATSAVDPPRKLPLLILPGTDDICSQIGSKTVVACMFVKFVLYRCNLRQSNWIEVSATWGHAQTFCLRSSYLCLQIQAHVTFCSESMWYSQAEYSKEEEMFNYFSHISDSVNLHQK